MKDYINTLGKNAELHGKSNRYRILKVLGQGAFGITYLAEIIPHSGKNIPGVSVKIAIKEFFIKSVNGREENSVTTGNQVGLFSEYKKKFLHEAENLAKMTNNNIVHVLEAFEENNTVYYSMEYIDGGSLDDYISKKGALSEIESVSIIRKIGNAVAYMHSLKMLHLDIKPLNVMRKSNGDIILIDFGLSKQYDKNGEPESSTQVECGTPGYAPVEQANYQDGHGFPVTMDIYALGATLYKMLTGRRPPFASDVLNEGFPMRIFDSLSVSKDTQAAIVCAMQPMKKNRPQSIGEFLNLLPLEADNDQENVTQHTEYTTVTSEELTDVEVVSYPQKCHTGKIQLGNGTKLIKCIFQNPEASNIDIKSYIIEIEPKRLKLWYINGNGKEFRRSYFLSSEKFNKLIKDINQLRLFVDENHLNKYNTPEIDFEVSSIDSNIIDCSSYKQNKLRLKGDIDSLCKLFEELANIDKQIIHSDSPISNKLLYFLIHNKLLIFLHCLLAFIVAFFYIVTNPWDNYIENTFNTQKYNDDKEYYVESISNGKAGVFFKPSNTWVVSPKYDYEDSGNDIYVPDIYLSNERNGYAIIEVEDKKALFSPQGDKIIPFKYAGMYFISDNVIKCWNWNIDKDDYYDINGKQIYDGIEIFNDKYGWTVNAGAIVCLILIGNIILFICTRKRWKCK